MKGLSLAADEIAHEIFEMNDYTSLREAVERCLWLDNKVFGLTEDLFTLKDRFYESIIDFRNDKHARLYDFLGG